MNGELRSLVKTFLGLGVFLFPALALASGGHGGVDIEAQIGHVLPYWTVVPFALLLLGIAVLPLAVEHWWESNTNKGIVAALFGLPMLLYFLFAVDHGGTALLHVTHEYYSFIMLLFALFTISGGIFLSGDLRATPATNTGFLAIGSLLASFIGTTGAAMLLIRPLLKTNSERHNVKHIYIFFIFCVANIGGSLLPIGDPPLFLGFLRGVPFFWTFNLWFEWLTALVILLMIFFIWDTYAYRAETSLDKFRDRALVEPVRFHGTHNFILLLGVILSVIFLRTYEHMDLQWFREPVMFLLAITSLMIDRTKKKRKPEEATPREKNKFTFHAITEVAVLFAGIFTAMLPAICLLKAHGSEFGVTEPWQFFWMTGMLSSFLDNAPTYVTFLSLAQGLGQAADGVGTTGVAPHLIAAISLGAVFMGANSYIGNAPNFMVKSIVEETGVKMPSFGGYLLYSFGILVPVFIFITLMFIY